jgi:drug/metabolite transporter (DMT)-like permease
MCFPWVVMDPPWSVWPIILIAGVIHGLYLWGLSGAYQSGTLTSTYPVARGSAPLLVALFGIWVLDQTPGARTIGGAVGVAVGLLLIGNVALGRGDRRGLLLALMTGCFIAGYTVVDARGAEEVGGLGFFAAVAVVGAIVVVMLGRVSPRRLLASAREAIVVGLFANSAYGLVLLAYTRGDAANVATLRATSILFGLALVRRTVTRRLGVGAVLVVAGSILVSW